jgi:hypothetical protein
MATKLQMLQDHCKQFEEALEGCGSVDEAERAREEVCDRLGEVCKSEMMREMLAEHARMLIRERLEPGPVTGG